MSFFITSYEEECFSSFSNDSVAPVTTASMSHFAARVYSFFFIAKSDFSWFLPTLSNTKSTNSWTVSCSVSFKGSLFEEFKIRSSLLQCKKMNWPFVKTGVRPQELYFRCAQSVSMKADGLGIHQITETHPHNDRKGRVFLLKTHIWVMM